MMPVGPSGYTPSTGATPKGEAHNRYASIGKGRDTPRTREMPFARHMGIKIFVTDTTVTTSGEAAQNVIDQWDEWRKNPLQSRVTIQDVTFDYVTETKVALYVIYSD